MSQHGNYNGYLKDKKKEKTQIIILFPIVLFVLWGSITTFIQAIKAPEMTQTELLMNMPKSFILNFEN